MIIWHTKLWRGNVAAGNFKSEGCVGEVVIKPKFNKNEIETGFLYLYYKLFQPEKLRNIGSIYRYMIKRPCQNHKRNKKALAPF